MIHGFIKAAACTPEIRVADCDYNAKAVIERVMENADAKLIVFPELCVTGYTCGDLFLQRTLISAAFDALKSIRQATASIDAVIVVGLPVAVLGKLYNCAAVLHKGGILGLVPKSNIPNYAEFYELRHFAAAPEGVKYINIGEDNVPFGADILFRCANMPEFTLAVEICEDLWTPAPPSLRHAVAGAAIIANLSASDETVSKADYRRQLVKTQSARLICGYVYANAGEGESTTDMVFAGQNMIAENGAMLCEAKRFATGSIVSDIDVFRMCDDRRRMNTFVPDDRGHIVVEFEMDIVKAELLRSIDRHPFVPEADGERKQRCEDILAMQSTGLKTRLRAAGCENVAIGISGGLDSTLAILVAVRAFDMLGLPRAGIHAVTMPCFGTSKRTYNNALSISGALGVTLREVNIKEAVALHFRDIGHDPNIKDTVYENAQARERTQVLMDIANQINGLVIGTGDLSELALGWATYNGDHMSMYAVNSAVPKTLVRHLVKYEADRAQNKALKAALEDVLDTPVSPELLPPSKGAISQQTEDIIGPYELHDFFLYNIVRLGFSPGKVFRLCALAYENEYSAEEILKWLKVFYKRFFSQQFKRSCLPDGPKIGSVTLSPRSDWRMPSDASVNMWQRELDRL
ncbi:MAG: NAD(+) synthase [Christensenellales bacterium]